MIAVALPHAQPGEVIAVDSDLSSENATGTRTLFKTSHLEVIRLVLPQGKSIPRHQAPREIIVQCIDGAHAAR